MKAAVRRPGIAKNAVMRDLRTRAQGAGGRVNASLQGHMGVASTGTDDIVQGLHQDMRDVAAAHDYDGILNNGIVEYGPELQDLMTGPTMQSAMGSARRTVKNDIARGLTDSSTQDFFKIDPNGGLFAPFGGFSGDMATRPTLRAWDYVKRGLDKIISDQTDPLTGKLSSKGAEAVDFKAQMMPLLDSGNPAYLAVRQAYSEPKAAESALNLGRHFMSDAFDVTNRRLANMTPADRKYFQIGAARAVQDKIESGVDTGMNYADFLNRTGLRNKLRAAFSDNPQAFDAFMEDLGKEATKGRTFATLRAGSDTMANANADAELGGGIVNGIPISKEGIARRLGLMLTQPNEEVSGQLARLLGSADPATKAQLLPRLQRLAPSLNRSLVPNRARPYIAPTAAGVIGQQAGQRAN